MLDEGVAQSEEEAVRLGQRLLATGQIEHVHRSEPFSNSALLYRFPVPFAATCKKI
jgi:hypothetical protein